MAEGLWGERGGIRGLLELIDEHREAIEYDLISLGLRLDWLGSERLSWRDLLVIVQQMPQGSALDRSMHPDAAPWGISEQLLASVFDSLQISNWQRAGGKRQDFPKPVPRPGVEPDSKTYGRDAIPMDQMAEALGWSLN